MASCSVPSGTGTKRGYVTSSIRVPPSAVSTGPKQSGDHAAPSTIPGTDRR
jgi:hypothetical protein